MISYEFQTHLPKGKDSSLNASSENKELYVQATHFNNTILLQIRLNGEMDSTYEVSSKGLNPILDINVPLAGNLGNTGGDYDDEEEEFVRDHLSDYQVVTKLGDSADPKVPVVCVQIAELYRRVILPEVSGTMAQDNMQFSLLISMSSKIWRATKEQSADDNDFGRLVFVLKCIKDMYAK
ncbi:ADI_G0040770.mRNA.1.CDS.1 [Saccharomyces cerevisiae]|uniref:Proteasome chaperone 3 n=1 Tax=Saccharomyces cerevisiae (strain RM11-1a) TaxID=285006 RepID=B3LSZ4_YEAS1|nr:Irc25p [Saccharomyces cerevisiae YJM993]AJV46560.1 Irc25p [Saccharomyces cerevisiae YJM1129]AJV61827.1 Irc25p [Saccharomyces cerevisiae YJM1415]AJV62281.1 Irc25p [Saccharomyces cerevisiae YJM1417]AJV73421.1 Irc25p [Saccharomyces cerevisiae YJM244]AJV82725.1 Irc25p [Saccharomyces cerevisiae YJM969]AJV83631.1 Irc25p [Saccharomyces cerevisiae YJM975]AJV84538.1 Irc25p [Saccharomyces cerevisiae YJM981]AJV85898.1 Irc25p [Saccharomyces cerevisiae YJM990]AJV86352.1 Irc25p [Saccharomyces cerevis